MHRSLRIGGGALDSKALAALRSGPYEGKIAGLYDLEETLGRGHFAVVKLARHVFTGEKVAVKVIDKSKLDEVSKAHLFQEVRCMKLVQHPNVVRLYEVIDTATKLYLILELGDGGDLYDYIMRHDSGLSEQVAKEYFGQIVKAISYCHQLHVVHRDLKPENVVFFEKLGVVKLTDFGFSNKFCPGQKLETSCGSLAYSAPEILLGDSYDAPAVDVWSLGVILYMLVCGQAPFQEANDSETLTMIMDCKYSVPPHVSQDCQNLIARMLVRNPEKRATLGEIATHPWLVFGKQDSQPLDALPLVSREQVSEEDHNFIVQKIVNGNIATKEEIQESLDKNEYNHITATYYLLAERKLRSKRQDHSSKSKRPDQLAMPHGTPVPKRDNNGTGPTPCLLAVPRTPGDVPQRSRKCSIVQEDEEEEDMSSCSGREELVPPLNRRGSRSEGRLNLALQERLADSERRKPPHPEKTEPPHPPGPAPKSAPNARTLPPPNLLLNNNNNNNNVVLGEPSGKYVQCGPNLKWRMGKSASLVESPVQAKMLQDMAAKGDVTTTTIITDSSTISIPIVTASVADPGAAMPKYKTMPSPTRNAGGSPLQLNEIFEEGDSGEAPKSTSRQFVSRNQNRTTYEQRRSKFHKTRTASCSSSDASDDDSEKRKKRAHKIGTTPTKPFQGRRDSHDDSSDSQEPGGGGAAAGNNARVVTSVATAAPSTNGTQQNQQQRQQQQQQQQQSQNKEHSSGGGGRKSAAPVTARRHKSGRRRTGETRLRESQSLNRITEVQEDGTHALVVVTTVPVVTQATPKTISRSFGARILHSFNVSNRKSCSDVVGKVESDKGAHVSRKDSVKSGELDDARLPVEPNNKELVSTGGFRRMRLLGKYLQVHKRICIPLPGLFSRNRLYKAQSCGSLARDRISLNNGNGVGDGSALRCRQRAVSVIRDDGDINRNDDNAKRKSSTVVQLNNVCNELTGICAIHLGQASKCCSFC